MWIALWAHDVKKEKKKKKQTLNRNFNERHEADKNIQKLNIQSN